MTLFLYQTDCYLKTFQARVKVVDSQARSIILDQTAFYPGGGGQPNDLGWITAGGTRFDVTGVKKIGGEAVHFLSGDATLPDEGTEIQGEIDWERRYRLMRTHTAMHILCGVVFRDYGALVTGGDMEPLKGRMDFEFESLQKEFVAVIEAAVNKEIAQARPISVAILDREEAFKIPDLIRTKINLLPEGIQQVRVVRIEGLDLQADGGTHVHNTSEVGGVRVVDYKSKGKINKRIYLEVID
ncbi:MAG: alanyl-tRNA editing protein [Anaerolineaceae bacterium]